MRLAAGSTPASQYADYVEFVVTLTLFITEFTGNINSFTCDSEVSLRMVF